MWDWDGLGLIGLERVMGGGDVKSGRIGLGLGWVVIGIGRLCVVCATTRNCYKCNKSIQIHAPG